MNERTHIDLFSGIGGFALAASWNGVRTVQFCEIDRRCREFLSRAWPGVPCHDDIRTFHGTGPVWLLTGGVPCQPASRAGKQRGSSDDRWLWPEACRCLAEIRSTWALFENPPGIGDVGLSGILAEMEAIGYAVRVLGIPACAVSAPHRRERYWIMAHSGQAGRWEDTRSTSEDEAEHARGPSFSNHKSDRNGESAMAYSSGSGCEGPDAEPGAAGLCAEHRQGDWSNFVWLPCADGKVRRAPDDSIGLVDGLHRSLLGALGNSIVPQVAARIIAAMIEAEEQP